MNNSRILSHRKQIDRHFHSYFIYFVYVVKIYKRKRK